MDTYPYVTQVLQGNNVYQLIGGQYMLPGQQQTESTNPPLQVFDNQDVQHMTATAKLSNGLELLVGNHFQKVQTSAPNTSGTLNNFYIPQPGVNKCNVYNVQGLKTNKTANPVQVSNVTQVSETSRNHQLKMNIPEFNTEPVDHTKDVQQKTKVSEQAMKGVMEIPEPKQVKINADKREIIGRLKICISESFIQWKTSGRTILDLSFMRHLFDVTNVDIMFSQGVTFETGLCGAMKHAVGNKLLSDWLILKCEEKQIPFCDVNDQVGVYTVNNFTTLLSIIAQESCLPLPFITRDEKGSIKYFYINFSKEVNNRVKKLSGPIFYDADNGRKKLSCKHPGIRLDCNFEKAFQRFVIYIHESALEVYQLHLSNVRQVIIYNHVVWGFLQSWTRRVMERYNGCFKIQEVAQSLTIYQADGSESRKLLNNENDMIYNINYMNLYLRFDPVMLKQATTSICIDNFETNYVCDVSIIQYYRQFFLVNDMHYSDALRNIVLFSQKEEENNSKSVPEFLRLSPKEDGTEKQRTDFSSPGGINKSLFQNRGRPRGGNTPGQATAVGSNSEQTESESDCRLEYAKIVPPVTVNSVSANPNLLHKEQPVQKPNPSSLPKVPLLKTRTVEEINSSVDLKKGGEGSQIDFDSCVKLNSDAAKQPDVRKNQPDILNHIRRVLNHCYLVNKRDDKAQDEFSDPKQIQRRFREALEKAMKTDTIDSFILKLYGELKQYFTNQTCQIIMDKTIYAALERRFSHLKGKLVTCKKVPFAQGTTASEPSNQTEDPPTTTRPRPAKVYEGPRKFRAVNSDNNKSNANSQKGESIEAVQRPTSPAKDPKSNSQTVHVPKTIESVLNKKRSNTTDLKSNAVEVSENERRNAGSSVLSTNQNSKEKSCTVVHPAKSSDVTKTVETNNSCNVKIKEKSNPSPDESSRTVESNEKSLSKPRTPIKIRIKIPKPKLSEPGNDEDNSYRVTSQTVTGPRNPVSTVIPPMPPLVPFSQMCGSLGNGDGKDHRGDGDGKDHRGDGDGKDHRGDGDGKDHREPDTVEEEDQTLTGPDQTDGGSLSEEEEKETKPLTKEDLMARFDIKPCSVMLNRNDVELYEKSKRLRNSTRKRVFPTSIPKLEDLSDEEFVPELRSRKRMKIISELEYMEARTRVLQRLRKRRKMFINCVSKREALIYTSDELDQFVADNASRGASKDSDPYRETSDNEILHAASDEELREEAKEIQIQYHECLTRKVRVVLKRLEQTEEYGRYMSKAKTDSGAFGNESWNRDTQLDGVPQDKRKFFEIKDGKLYLKEQYNVKNGVIVPVEKQETQFRLTLKVEPSSPRHEPEFLSSVVKREASPL